MVGVCAGLTTSPGGNYDTYYDNSSWNTHLKLETALTVIINSLHNLLLYSNTLRV